MEKEIKSIEIAHIIANELQQTHVQADEEKLNEWLEESAQNMQLFEQLQQEDYLREEIYSLEAIDTNAAWQRLSRLIIPKPKGTLAFFKTLNLRVAASIIVVLSFATWLLWYININNKVEQTTTQLLPVFKNDVAPGGDKAILTLEDGSSIDLEALTNGTTISDSGLAMVKKLSSGQLVYKKKYGNGKATIGMHTLSIPRGGQYRLVLPDGSKVWLNAASKLRYPNSFVGNERLVELEGEAYFEVEKNPSKPFIVKTRFQQTVVLGTQFNVNSYHDEPAELITLTEGKVNIITTNENGITNKTISLEPGTQASVNSEINKRIVNVDGVVAWKEGMFQFEEVELSVIMRQLSRWYDVDVKYVNQGTKAKFSGKLPRTMSLNSLLRILDLSDVKFRVEGRTITVL
jgi:ferric-dicitrate binding protein FerR (iron transport regulator)